MNIAIGSIHHRLFGNNQTPKRPSDTDIRHITLNSCHGSNIPRGKITHKAVKAYKPLLLDNRWIESNEENDQMIKSGGRHPLPGSGGALGILASSDPTCGGNECTFTIFLRGPNPNVLAFGRYYNAIDKKSDRKWNQLVQTFMDGFENKGVSLWPAFNHKLLIDPPQTPWLGVMLTTAYDILEKNNPELGLYLSSAEQAIAVTWNTICREKKG